MKKRNLLLVLALAGVMCFTACAGNTDQATTDADVSGEPAAEQWVDPVVVLNAKREEMIAEKRVDLAEETVFNGEGADIKVKAYSIIDWNEENVEEKQMYFVFDYTNKSGEDVLFSSQINIACYQDGEELKGASYWDENDMFVISPDATEERKAAVVVNNEESDVTLKITEYATEKSSEFVIKLK